MSTAVLNKIFSGRRSKACPAMTRPNPDLTHAKVNTPYVIEKIDTCDAEVQNFLLTLGCYEGQNITVLSVLAGNHIVLIKDARYSIDAELARAIHIRAQ